MSTRALRVVCGGGVAASLALLGAAASRYPGGTWWDRRTRGYSPWQNFLCDLFHHRALNGEDNVASAGLASLGTVVMLVAMAAFFGLVARIEAPPSRAARWSRAVGTVSCALGVAIPLTPSDRHRVAHLAVMIGISLPSLVALGLAARVTLGARARGGWSRVAAALASLSVTLAALDAVAYALATQTRALDLWLAPTQRLAMIATLGWVVAVVGATGSRPARS